MEETDDQQNKSQKHPLSDSSDIVEELETDTVNVTIKHEQRVKHCTAGIHNGH